MTSTDRTATQIEQRKPGRPVADGVDQRERLLDAAILSFADRGIASTSQRALAADAGVTPAMLNYYFGSKQQLVETAVSERLLPVLERMKERVASQVGGDCTALVTAFVAAVHAAVDECPWLPGLWVREVLTEGGQLRSVFTQGFGAKLPRPMAERFAQAQAAGELNPDLDPRLLFVSLIGLTMLPLAAAPVWRQVFEAGDIDSSQMLAHTLALLSGGLKP